jgi:hypothetical protein
MLSFQPILSGRLFQIHFCVVTDIVNNTLPGRLLQVLLATLAQKAIN